MQYWLLKSEPEEYSWDILVRQKKGVWDGVRNHKAASYMRQMQVGDLAYFYHTGKAKEIVGVMRITRAAFQDPTDSSGRFVAVEVQPVSQLAHPVSLAQMREDKALSGFIILQQSRLSVAPVTEAQWQHISAMAQQS